jgi:hypothetical protein
VRVSRLPSTGDLAREDGLSRSPPNGRCCGVSPSAASAGRSSERSRKLRHIQRRASSGGFFVFQLHDGTPSISVHDDRSVPEGSRISTPRSRTIQSGETTTGATTSPPSLPATVNSLRGRAPQPPTQRSTRRKPVDGHIFAVARRSHPGANRRVGRPSHRRRISNLGTTPPSLHSPCLKPDASFAATGQCRNRAPRKNAARQGWE